MKKAILSMDVEDWYHLDYFSASRPDKSLSMLDGLHNYVELLAAYEIKTTFFALGELAQNLKSDLQELAACGHEIASHGWSHERPLLMTPDKFREDLRRSKGELEDCLGQQVIGYRAPCFSLDRARLDIVAETGYLYDSSLIQFGAHPLYGTIDTTGFMQHPNGTLSSGGFCEFEVSTLNLRGRRIPVSGGGYLRIVPWPVMRLLLDRFLGGSPTYVFYIHPFELSERAWPPLGPDVKSTTKARFKAGRASMKERVHKLVGRLKRAGFEFTTFSELRVATLAELSR